MEELAPGIRASIEAIAGPQFTRRAARL